VLAEGRDHVGHEDGLEHRQVVRDGAAIHLARFGESGRFELAPAPGDQQSGELLERMAAFQPDW
jgi:hypothetical protein